MLITRRPELRQEARLSAFLARPLVPVHRNQCFLILVEGQFLLPVDFVRTWENGSAVFFPCALRPRQWQEDGIFDKSARMWDMCVRPEAEEVKDVRIASDPFLLRTQNLQRLEFHPRVLLPLSQALSTGASRENRILEQRLERWARRRSLSSKGNKNGRPLPKGLFLLTTRRQRRTYSSASAARALAPSKPLFLSRVVARPASEALLLIAPCPSRGSP